MKRYTCCPQVVAWSALRYASLEDDNTPVRQGTVWSPREKQGIGLASDSLSSLGLPASLR